MTEQGKLKLEKYKRKFRKRKLFLLGNARAGTSLIHKCLLITGLVNWGPWALDVYESEPKIRMIWTHYPNVNTNLLKPKNFLNGPVPAIRCNRLIMWKRIYGYHIHRYCRVLFPLQPLQQCFQLILNWIA